MSRKGKEPVLEELHSPLEVSEESQGPTPPPPPPLTLLNRFPIPIVRGVPRPRPPRPPHQTFSGKLYIRGFDQSDVSMVATLDLTTVCPTSLCWLIYLSAVQKAKPNFQFQTIIITDDKDPRFEMNHVVYPDLEAFITTSFLSLEPRQREEPIHPLESETSRKVREEREKKKNHLLRQIEEKKLRVKQALTTLESAYLCAYSFITKKQWLSKALSKIKDTLNFSSDEEIQQHYLAHMDNACRTLCYELGDCTYFLDALWERFEDRTMGTGMTNLSILDAKQTSSILLIMSLASIQSSLPAYISDICTKLKEHIQLWTQANIMYTWFMKKQFITDFSTILQAKPTLLAQVCSGSPQASGGFGNIYKLKLPPQNEWGLPAGDYAFKVPRFQNSPDRVEFEGEILRTLPYVNVVRLVGDGAGHGVNPNMLVNFLVIEWMDGGDLEKRRKDLKWEQIKNIIKRLAYAVYVVHRTGYVVLCDLKPANVLLDKCDNPVLCDFGAILTVGGLISTQSSLYHTLQDGREASWAHDVLAYGMILCQLLMEEVSDNLHRDGEGAVVADRITKHIDTGGCPTDLLKQQLKQQLKQLDDNEHQEEIARKLIDLGARCLRNKKERVTDLEIIQELHMIEAFDMVDCLLFRK